MNNTPIEQKMLQLLRGYRELVVQQLQDNNLVGEYLTKPVGHSVRLLCQMRTIAFLVKTAPLFDNTNITLAETLYFQTERQYLTEDGWLQKTNELQEASLYTCAFVLLAQSYLYKATKDSLYAVAMAETFSLIEQNFNKAYQLFKPVSSDLDCFEQNSAMHLYEALTFACYQADAVYMQQAVKDLEALIQQVFWRADKQLLAEKVTANKEVLSYELGHCLEWVSLLWRVRQWGGTTYIDPESLYRSAVDKGSFSNEGLVLNEMDSELKPINSQQIRIWPNLEYIRAKVFIMQCLPDELLNTVINLFFDEQGLPLEYIGVEAEQPVKSTTGYHIAESFIDILDYLKTLTRQTAF